MVSSKRKARRIPEQLERLIDSEELLLQAVAGLLTRMPGVEGVQIFDGPGEIGKDIIFRWKGAFGESLPCACVVKNTPITGSAASGGGARTVYHQVEQALDTPYKDESGEAIQIQRIYVVTPHQVSQIAMNSISGALRSRTGQVIYISGHELLRLFQAHWPNFLADEASALQRYLTSITGDLERNPELQHVSSLYDIGIPPKTETPVYVDLALAAEFGEFTFGTPVADLIPSNEELEREDHWTRDEHPVLLRSRYNQMIEIVGYLADCGLWPRDRAESLRSITALCDGFIKLYPKAWLDFVLKNFPHRPNQVPNLPDGARVGLEHLGELKQICAELRSHLDPGLHDLQSLLSQQRADVAAVEASTLREGDLLLWGPFIRTMYVETCMRFLPFPGITRQPRWAVEFSPRLLESCSGSLLITGPVGSGKTSFSRWNALRDIRLFKEGRSRRLPIYVALSNLVWSCFR